VSAPRKTVVVTGLDVTTAYGRGEDALWTGLGSGVPAFRAVDRFGTGRGRTNVAATLPGDPDLETELTAVVTNACDQAGLSETDRARTPLLLARHADGAVARLDVADQEHRPISLTARTVAAATGLFGPARTYTNACVAGTTAVIEGIMRIAAGEADRVVVAAGYLVDPDNFALFSAGRALAADGLLRPFSDKRQGLLLGDGVGAVVLESAESAERRSATVRAVLAGWGMAGDAFHVCQPHPRGEGMARAIESALRRAEWAPSDLGYVNCHGTGTKHNDASESAALHASALDDVPVSSTKSMHGHTLEASGLVELAVTILTLRHGRLPLNANYLGEDPECALRLVLDRDEKPTTDRALSLNAAFGGANAVLAVSAP